ncbi:hypothetical protein PMG11_01929 [Penicillium brasilianum]|uniref:BTB domain-containing protein n=1 Tax=Penicillium brasilianum TaxID=104259 RepID=A0A0F7TGM0_PENBI|nr:hypothetical protein PMG11_01929 [Penicillium brasilianum]
MELLRMDGISVQSQGVLEALSRCQKSGEFTDLVLVCEGERINVHKVVVCSQSNVLHAACTGNFKASMSFWMTQKLLLESWSASFTRKTIATNLLALCVEKYQRRLQSLSDPIEFIESIPEVYALPLTSTKTLKEVAARFARINISNYLREETVQIAYNSVAQSVPEFVKDLLDLYIQAPLLGNCENCGQHVEMLALQGRCRRCRRGTTAI